MNRCTKGIWNGIVKSSLDCCFKGILNDILKVYDMVYIYILIHIISRIFQKEYQRIFGYYIFIKGMINVYQKYIQSILMSC